MENRICDEKTIFGTKSKAIVVSLALSYPKKKHNLSAYGGSGTQGILNSTINSVLQPTDKRETELYMAYYDVT